MTTPHARIVSAKDYVGFAGSLHPRGPKWSIVCGDCGSGFRARIPRVNPVAVRCPLCGAVNRLDGVQWGHGEGEG